MSSVWVHQEQEVNLFRQARVHQGQAVNLSSAPGQPQAAEEVNFA